MSDMTFASLSPTLLARKGGAKPAMRRQSPIIDGAVPGAQAQQPENPDALEDLGWNDLGDTQEDATQAPATQTDSTEAQQVEKHEAADDFAPLGRHANSTANPSSETVARETVADETVAEESEPASASANTASNDDFENVTPIRRGAPRLPRPRPIETSQVQPKARRTAFTLRLDQDRHLKLRMACTLAGRSAQALVTEALDAMLADIPELDQLVARVHSRPTREG